MTDAYSARENLSSLPTMDGSRTALYLPIADTRPQTGQVLAVRRNNLIHMKVDFEIALERDIVSPITAAKKQLRVRQLVKFFNEEALPQKVQDCKLQASFRNNGDWNIALVATLLRKRLLQSMVSCKRFDKSIG